MSGYWHAIEAEAFGYESEWADISVSEYREPKPARFAGENLKAVNDAWEFRRVYLHQWLMEQWEAKSCE